MMVVSTGKQSARIGLPLGQGLKFDRMRGDIGHIQRAQLRFRRIAIVIGGTADQRESGEGNHGVDTWRAIAKKEFFDCRTLIQTTCKGRG